MSVPVNVRASDRSDFAANKQADFAVRKRGRYSAKQIYTVCLLALVIVVGVSILVHQNAMMGSVLCIVVGCALLILAKQAEKQYNTLHAAEFLNALFASALGAGHKFCMIAKQDGEIVYLDRPFQEMFPEMVEKPRRQLADLLSMYHASDSDRDAVVRAFAANTESVFTFRIEGGKHHTMQSITLHIEPILRPSGFVLVRGREA